MNLNLKPYLYRTFDGDVYLIPVELIERFDELVDSIEGDDEEIDDFMYETINADYSSYKMEDDLDEIVLWINPDDLT